MLGPNATNYTIIPYGLVMLLKIVRVSIVPSHTVIVVQISPCGIPIWFV